MNRTESPEVEPHQYSQVAVDEGAKATQWARTVLSTNGAGATGHHMQEMNLDIDLTPVTKTNSK